MKLSDIKGERTFDVIADVIGPITNIAEDDAAMELFRAQEVPAGMTPRQFFVKRARKAAPIILKNHRGDVVEILAALEGVTPSEYVADLSLAKLIGGLVELLTDEALLDFLPQSETEGASSGDASVLTLDRTDPTPSTDTSSAPTSER